MNNYDIIILNNCPSFYKINLYNEINKSIKIYVIFLGFSDQVIIDDDFKRNISFDFKILNEFQVEKRSFLKTFSNLASEIYSKSFQKIIYGGYIEKEFLLLSLFISKKKNILQSESGLESTVSGWKKTLKQLILSRYCKAVVSGINHKKMLQSLNFKDEVTISKGVGIFRKIRHKNDSKNYWDSDLKPKFLYVGRLIEKKNISFLIEVFNENGLPLTIVGDGPLLNQLKEQANSNIVFKGHCSNNEIHKIYKDHQIFILPSIVEPWGLVVEEALFYECVLLLSENVGCKNEMLSEPNTGASFDPVNKASLMNAINIILSNYNIYLTNVKNVDFNKRDIEQVNTYINLLND